MPIAYWDRTASWNLDFVSINWPFYFQVIKKPKLLFNLSGQADIFLGSWTWRKSDTLLFTKKQGAKNQVIVIQKEKRPGYLFLCVMTEPFSAEHRTFIHK